MTRTVVQILGHGDIAELARTDRTDGQLLDLFVRLRDPEAFAAVVRRHGPMVLGVCRRVLRNAADADDAFQAAFLVLARKAATIGTRDLLANWLYGVAYNTARKLRQMNTRRGLREQPLADLPEPLATTDTDSHAELVAILDEELGRLPEHYRTAIVLCDLEGATRREAARRLGWPEGTVAGRLARARAMLAERLAGRGVVVPAALLAAVLTERYTSAAVCGNEFIHAVATGQVAPRIADTTERVVHAMFVQKLKPIGLALAMCGLMLAGLAGLAHLTATAQPTPKPADPRAEKPDDKAKVAVAIPLKKLEAKEAAETLAQVFAKTLTVVAARGENTLVLYDTPATIAKVRGVLEQLGEKEAAGKPMVIPLKNLSADEAAKVLSEIFNGPDGGKRVRVTALARENALAIEASELDMQIIRELLRDYIDKGAAADAAEPKRHTVNFRNAAWKEVLDWYAEASGLTPLYTVKPAGTVTITPPKDRQYTLGEITDLINEALIQQKFILVRRDLSFTLHPSDEKIDFSQIPRIELSEVSRRGKTELVQVLLPLKVLDAKDTAPEVQKMLTPFGALATLAKMNTLIIVDTAGNINRIAQTIEQIENGNPAAPKPGAGGTDPRDPRGIPPDFDPRDPRFNPRPIPKKDDKPAAVPKKYTIHFKDQSWADVLEWYAKEADLTPAYTAKPAGNVTIQPPKDRQFTIAEVTDLLNDALAREKFLLVRRQTTFTLMPTDQIPDYSLVPRIELADLPSRGKTELVQVLLPFKSVAVKEVSPDLQKMLTPLGKVTMIEPANTLIVTDTAGNINRIIDTCCALSGESMIGPPDKKFNVKPDAEPEIRKYAVPAGKADEVAKQILKDVPNTRVIALPSSDEVIVMGTATNHAAVEALIKKPPANEKDTLTHKCQSIKATELTEKLKQLYLGQITAVITVDEKNNSLTITGTSGQLSEVKKCIDAIDYSLPRKPSPDQEFRLYRVPAGTAEAVAETLQADFPNTIVMAVTANNSIAVFAKQEEHLRIEKTLNPGTNPKKPQNTPPQAPMPAAPKKMSLRMTDQSWEKVLEWYASATGLKPMYTVKLSGTFSHTSPSADTRYTVGEITDILNDALAKQKLLLIRRQVTFTIVSTQDQPQQNWSLIPRIEQSELPDRGRTEMVQVLFYPRAVSVEDILPAVTKLVSPLGAASMLRNGTVVVVDRVDNIRRIAQLIADAEASEARK